MATKLYEKVILFCTFKLLEKYFVSKNLSLKVVY